MQTRRDKPPRELTARSPPGPAFPAFRGRVGKTGRRRAKKRVAARLMPGISAAANAENSWEPSLGIEGMRQKCPNKSPKTFHVAPGGAPPAGVRDSLGLTPAKQPAGRGGSWEAEAGVMTTFFRRRVLKKHPAGAPAFFKTWVLPGRYASSSHSTGLGPSNIMKGPLGAPRPARKFFLRNQMP